MPAEDASGRPQVSWSVLATLLGYRCEDCQTLIEYEHRDTYFRTKRCATCSEKAASASQ